MPIVVADCCLKTKTEEVGAEQQGRPRKQRAPQIMQQVAAILEIGSDNGYRKQIQTVARIGKRIRAQWRGSWGAAGGSSARQAAWWGYADADGKGALALRGGARLVDFRHSISLDQSLTQ